MFHRKLILTGKEPETELERLIKAEFLASKGIYGVRRITAALRAKGNLVNHKTVQRIMRKLGLKGKRPKKVRKYSSYKGTVGTVADNILNRHFKVDTPRMVFVTDVTEFNLGKEIGKVYLSPVMDLFNREIIGYDISRHPDFGQIRRMMKSAFGKTKVADRVG